MHLVGGEPDSLCVVVDRGGGLQIRRGEATRYAGFEAPGGPVCPPVCLPRSGCWATGSELVLWGLPFACACKWNAPVDREGEGEREAGPQGPSPAAGLKWECYAAASATAGGSPSNPSTLPDCHPPSLPPSPFSLVQFLQSGSPLWQSGSPRSPTPAWLGLLFPTCPGLPNHPKPPHHQLRPPFLAHPAAPLDCMPDTRAYASTDNDWRRSKTRRWAWPLRSRTHTHAKEQANKPTSRRG